LDDCPRVQVDIAEYERDINDKKKFRGKLSEELNDLQEYQNQLTNDHYLATQCQNQRVLAQQQKEDYLRQLKEEIGDSTRPGDLRTVSAAEKDAFVDKENILQRELDTHKIDKSVAETELEMEVVRGKQSEVYKEL